MSIVAALSWKQHKMLISATMLLKEFCDFFFEKKMIMGNATIKSVRTSTQILRLQVIQPLRKGLRMEGGSGVTHIVLENRTKVKKRSKWMKKGQGMAQNGVM